MACLLLSGAFPPEIDLLQQELHDSNPSELLVSRLYPQLKLLEPITIEILEVGIGPLQAALGLQQRLLQKKSKGSVLEVLFFGSAGVYPHALCKDGYSYGPGSYSLSRNFYFHDLATIEGKAKQPPSFLSHVQTRASNLSFYLAERLRQSSKIKFFSEKAATNTPLSISLVEPSFPSVMKIRSHFQLENLETFGLAQVAALYDLPFAAFLALTNPIGEKASSEWEKTHRSMSVTLQELVLESLTKAKQYMQ